MGVLSGGGAEAPAKPLALRRVLLVVNPAARRAARVRRIAERAIRDAGVECEVLLTDRPGAGGAAAAERHGDFDAVFTLGGDGTAMEVVGALAGTGRPVGILAGGTGNLLARTLGIPLGVRRAVRSLLHDGRAIGVDLGRIEGGAIRPGAPRRFAFAAGVGIDATMIEHTPPALKRRLGVLAYAVTAARAVLRRETFTVRATVDGVVHECPGASAAMVANFGAVLHDLITLGPGIRHDDGLLDLCVFSPGSHADAVRVMWRLLRHDFASTPHLLYVRGSRFRVETDPPRAAEADGELLGTTPFEVEVEAGAATLLVPRRRR